MSPGASSSVTAGLDTGSAPALEGEGGVEGRGMAGGMAGSRDRSKGGHRGARGRGDEKEAGERSWGEALGAGEAVAGGAREAREGAGGEQVETI